MSQNMLKIANPIVKNPRMDIFNMRLFHLDIEIKLKANGDFCLIQLLPRCWFEKKSQ